MTWGLPLVFCVMLLVIGIFLSLLPDGMQNGDPVVGILIAGLSLVGAQAFIFWLTERWARSQP